MTVNIHNKDSTLDSDGQTNAGSEDNYNCLLHHASISFSPFTDHSALEAEVS